jgi:hypothetical protein
MTLMTPRKVTDFITRVHARPRARTCARKPITVGPVISVMVTLRAANEWLSENRRREQDGEPGRP